MDEGLIRVRTRMSHEPCTGWNHDQINQSILLHIYIYGDIPRISRGVFVFTNYVSFVYVVAVFAKVWVS